MWEEKLSTIPPFFLAPVEDVAIEEIKSLKSCLDEGMGYLELDPLFLKNTAYIHRFIQLYRSQFRSFPCLQLMQKIKLAIEKIHKNNAKDAVNSVLSTFPVHLGTGYGLELPTRRYFDYCLARVLAHAQIMLRLVICCKKCAMYFVHFLQCGHFIEVSTMMIGLLGHVWQQARQSLMSIEPFYNQMVTLRSQFPLKKESDVNEFPATLASLFGHDWKDEVDVLVDQASTSYATSSAFHILCSEEKTSGESPDIKEPPRKVAKMTQMKGKLSSKTDDSDMGEVLSRGSIKAAPKTTSSGPMVTNKRSLTEFLRSENEFRIQKDRKSVTKKVSQFHWEEFRRVMESKMRIPNADLKDIFKQEWTKLLAKK